MHCALCAIGAVYQFEMSFVLHKNQQSVHECDLLEPSEGLQPHAPENTISIDFRTIDI